MPAQHPQGQGSKLCRDVLFLCVLNNENRLQKQAKKDLAMRILRQVHNFDLKVGQSAQEIVQSEEFTTNGIFADKISDAVNEQFYKLCEQQPSGEYHKMKGKGSSDR